jgi:hypothetical protein
MRRASCLKCRFQSPALEPLNLIAKAVRAAAPLLIRVNGCAPGALNGRLAGKSEAGGAIPAVTVSIDPAESAIATPAVETTATEGFDDVHTDDVVRYSIVLSESAPAAVN